MKHCVACVLWACLLVAIVAGTARAQHMTMSMGVLNSQAEFEPELSPRDVRVIERILELGNDEVAAIQTLYDGYAGELASSGAAIREEVRDTVEHAEVMQDSRLLEPAQRKIAAWEKQAETIKKKFLDDLRSLLTKDQESRWPMVERELRRYKSIGAGRIAGESVDLTRLADEVLPEIWRQPEATQILEQYAEAVDRAMVARDKLTEEKGGTSWGELITKDAPAAEKVYRDIFRAREEVRNVNRRFERQLEGVLTPESAKKLRDKFFELSFPQVCEATRGEKYVLNACESQDQTTDQIGQLAGIRETYLRDRDRWREAAANAYERTEEENMPRRLLEALGKLPPNPTGGWDAKSILPEDHPLVKLRRERLELDIAARKKVNGVLSAAQRRKLLEDESVNAYFADYTPWWP